MIFKFLNRSVIRVTFSFPRCIVGRLTRTITRSGNSRDPLGF